MYLLYYILLFVFSLYYKNAPNSSNFKGRVFLLLIDVLLILMIGLRAECIGIDTGQYAYIWNYDIKAGNFDYISTDAEVGYFYFQTFFKQFIDYQSFLVIIAIISIVPINWCIYKYSSRWSFTLLIFYASIAFHTLEFAAARQCLAFTGVVIAYHFLMRRNLKGYLVTLVFSLFFHQTAIIFLPCYWLYNIKLTKKVMLLWTGCLCVSFWLSKIIFGFLNSFSRIDYSTSDVAAGGSRLFMITLLFVVIGFMCNNKINSDVKIKMPFFIFSITPLLWPILNGNPALYRLQYYFEFFLCLYVPNLLYVLPKNSKLKIVLFCLTIFVTLYIVLYMRTSEAYYPYKFFWEK